jgi:hypothetical protein
MLLFTSKRSVALDRQIDSLIETYGAENPQLLRDLQAFKEALREAKLQGNAAKLASIMFRIATWVRFAIDHLPGP